MLSLCVDILIVLKCLRTAHIHTSFLHCVLLMNKDLIILNQMSNYRSHIFAFHTLISCSLSLYPSTLSCWLSQHWNFSKERESCFPGCSKTWMSAFFRYVHVKHFGEIIITDVSIILNFWFCVLGSQVNYTNIFERHALAFYFTGTFPEERGTIFVCITCSLESKVGNFPGWLGGHCCHPTQQLCIRLNMLSVLLLN